MSQRPNQYSHDEQNPGWDQEGRQRLNLQVKPTAEPSSYDGGIVREQPQMPGDLHPVHQAWYPTRNEPNTQLSRYADFIPAHPQAVTTAYTQPNIGDPDQHQWPDRPLQPSADVPYHPHQYAPYPSTYDANDLGQTTWTDRQHTTSSLERSHPTVHPYRLSPEHRVQDHTTSPAQARSARRHSPLASGVNQGGQNVIARHPSLQPSGPYTSTALQSPSEGSLSAHSTADPSSPRVYIPPSGPVQHENPSFPYAVESPTGVLEAPRFVVPSSRVSGSELSAYLPTIGQAATSPTSRLSQLPTETKPKRRRANATQLKLLNETYARTMFPTTEERAEIARRINMTPRQVQIWFQNRRQASKQQQSPEQLSSPGLYSQGSEDQAFSGASTPVATSEYLEASSAATPSTEAGSLGFLRDTEDEAH